MRQGENRRVGQSFPVSELQGLGTHDDRWSSQGEIRFALERDAGTFDFRGRFDGGRGTGTFTFAPNPEFVGAMRQRGGDIDDETAMRLAMQDVSRPFVASIEALGYKDLEVDDLIRMRIHGASSGFIKDMNELGYSGLSIDRLVQCRIHGVSPAFIKEMKDLGYSGLSVDRLVQFRIHGVDAEFVRKANAAGFKNLDADDLVDLSIHGRRWMTRRQ